MRCALYLTTVLTLGLPPRGHAAPAPSPAWHNTTVSRAAALRKRSCASADATGLCGRVVLRSGCREMFPTFEPARRSRPHKRAKILLSRTGARCRGKLDTTACASVAFYIAEEAFERYLAIGFPRRLNFAGGTSPQGRRVVRSSRRRFASYLQRKAKALARLGKQYTRVAAAGGRHATAARARVGQLYLYFAAQILAAPVPTPPIPGVLKAAPDQQKEYLQLFREKYCETLEDRTRPLMKKVVALFGSCLATRPAGPWASACRWGLRVATQGSETPTSSPSSRPHHP